MGYLFKKLVGIEPLNLTKEGMEQLKSYGEQVKFYDDVPKDDQAITERIGDADGVLLSYTSRIGGKVIEQCPNIRYIGMCCSLYAPESANVDIITANKKGIVVKGVRDYGDQGVPEYVISELVRLLHGFGSAMWKNEPIELTDLEIGVLGMGVSGTLVAKALKFFGAKVYYYSRTRKEELEKTEGFIWMPMENLLRKVDILCTCLNKNVILLGEEEFRIFGNGKILVNTSIGPSHEIDALEKWLGQKDNYVLSDSVAGIGSGELLKYSNVCCVKKTAGASSLSRVRLTQKVIDNVEEFGKEAN